MDDSLEQWVSDKTKVVVLQHILSFEDQNLEEFMAKLETARFDIPKEFRNAAMVEFEHGDYEWGDPAALEVYYFRPATGDEKKEQRQDEVDRRKEREDEARVKYERLKVKFG